MSKIEIYRDSLDYRVEGRPHNMVRATRTTKDGVEYIGVSVFPVNLSEKKLNISLLHLYRIIMLEIL